MQQKYPYSPQNGSFSETLEGYVERNKSAAVPADPADIPGTAPAEAQISPDFPVEIEDGNQSYLPQKNHYVPETLANTAFLPAYLLKNIGKLVKVEFLLNNQLQSRTGILMSVGASYLVLRHYQNNSTLVCDIYSIKFVTIVHDNDPQKLLMD